jgi:hypothetical protein
MGTRSAIASLALAVCACSSSEEFASSPADVAGTYTVAVAPQLEACQSVQDFAGTRPPK